MKLVVSCPSFRNIESAPRYDSEREEKNPVFLMWMWTLVLVREVVLRSTDALAQYVPFLNRYSNRIMDVLSFPDKVFRNHLNVEEKLKAAYLDELEYVLMLVNSFFLRGNNFSHSYRETF